MSFIVLGAYCSIIMGLLAVTLSAIVVLSMSCQLQPDLSKSMDLGFDQLCWHNFRIIETSFGGISIEHNASIIGSDLPNCRCG